MDSLQRLYAVIIALALTTALKNFLSDNLDHFDFSYDRLPLFVTLFVTAVPFVHGMNRHLDKTLARYLKAENETQNRRLFVTMVIDFICFSIQGCLFYVLAFLVKVDTVSFFGVWVWVHIVDSVWILIFTSISIRYTELTSATLKTLQTWMTINALAGPITIVAIGLFPGSFWIGWFLMAVAIARTVADYMTGWKLYFPLNSTDELPDRPPAVSGKAPSAALTESR